ncbi:transient receptor potential cation channel subfamily V member 3-like isoform X2 [Antechinus flavipes]|uniref:transient receptor potential cation channel subfamily V member 3-like isoform X2 n=1 Tax=Antechinus flavipes TaxID=38775 RepID=UPI002236512B|nr:transient receptor potential cation channel subfamily V member 3-like isoform X2 [Antechinus flavipes]
MGQGAAGREGIGRGSRSQELGDNGLPYRPEVVCKSWGDCPDGKVPDLDLQRPDKFRKHFFSSIAAGDLEAVRKQLEEILRHKLKLSGPELLEEVTGKTCLMKALLRSQDKKEKAVEDMVMLLLHHAQDSGDLPELLNASYTDKVYRGQTALHIAIERGLKDIVKRLVEWGADLQARATGLFFHPNPVSEDCFYFGEYPLSLAACTCQPDMVRFLMSRGSSDLARAQDTFKNTVLHVLVLRARNLQEMVSMYHLVLELSEKKQLSDRTASMNHLEKIRNLQGLTPLQLAAKEGQFELFHCILNRELSPGHMMAYLGRKFCEWSYGPISCSLYDLSEVDTTEPNSALKMVAFHPDMEKASDLLVVEPLRSLLQAKWASFAGALFAISTAWYLSYIGLFTALTAQRPGMEGSQESPGPTQSESPWRIWGQVYVFLSAVAMIVKTGLDINWMRPFRLAPFLLQSYFHVLCLFQAGLVLCSLGLSWGRAETAAVVQSPALVLGWFNLLYYSRGFKLTGIYTVVLQKMILHDVARFLLVYVVFLLGFASALSALSGPCPGPDHCPYDSVGNASGALFKLTLGLGDLSGPEHSSFPGFFLFVLIIYVILTSVLLLNMLIALMSETATEVSSRNEKIWQVQRAITILDMERCLPMAWRQRLLRDKILRDQKVGLTPSQDDDLRTCLRVNEEEWKKANVVARGQFMGIHEDPSVFPGMEK